MNRRSLLRNLMVAGAASFIPGLSARAAGKDEAPKNDKTNATEEDYILHSDVRLVLLDVAVKDHTGALVTGLSQENFQVFENGKQQMVTVFDHDDLPVTLGLLMDESGSMRPKRTHVLIAAGALIAESNPNDEMFVLNFNETVMPGLPESVPFSDDPIQLRDALARGVPQGRTALYDAVSDGLRHLELGRHAKKTLVLVSDGGDNVSHHTRRETADLVQRNLATIYTIGLFDEDDQDRDPGILSQLANISGGESYLPKSVKEMLPVCHRIARDIRSRYTVGYLPGSSGNSLRHVDVRVSAPGYGHLNTRTRSSYLYEEVRK
jgi:Ca-activated chloride channel family protein